jgi:hypothetical protein
MEGDFSMSEMLPAFRIAEMLPAVLRVEHRALAAQRAHGAVALNILHGDFPAPAHERIRCRHVGGAWPAGVVQDNPLKIWKTKPIRIRVPGTRVIVEIKSAAGWASPEG